LGKQYKVLSENDREFIKKQKLFYIASASKQEVNLSPKAYHTIQVLNESTVVFLDYPGSGNRTYRDTLADGEFTLLFNAFEGKAMILRLFCKAKIVENKSKDFYRYLEMFNEQESLVRNFFIFDIYAIESSCGDSIPYMEYKGDRDSLKNWMVKLDKTNKLEPYIQKHMRPPNIKNL